MFHRSMSCGSYSVGAFTGGVRIEAEQKLCVQDFVLRCHGLLSVNCSYFFLFVLHMRSCLSDLNTLIIVGLKPCF